MTKQNSLSHIDNNSQPVMVDVSNKAVTSRSATATAKVRFPADVFNALVTQAGVTA